VKFIGYGIDYSKQKRKHGISVCAVKQNKKNTIFNNVKSFKKEKIYDETFIYADRLAATKDKNNTHPKDHR